MDDEQTTTPAGKKDGNMMMWIIGLVIAIVIIIIVAVMVRNRAAQTQETTLETPTPLVIQEEATESAITSGDPTVSVSGQKAGTTATIDSVTFVKSGYIVIHQEKGGEAESIIGNSKLYQPGTYENVSVTLTRASKAGENLYAMLHDDDGDGAYKFPPDAPTQNTAREIVQAKFVIE